jgi:hypothetical protein
MEPVEANTLQLAIWKMLSAAFETVSADHQRIIRREWNVWLSG